MRTTSERILSFASFPDIYIFFLTALLTFNSSRTRQPVHVWHEVPGTASHGAHGPRLCCARCRLFPDWEGVCVGQFWQNHPHLSQRWRPQQVSNNSQKETRSFLSHPYFWKDPWSCLNMSIFASFVFCCLSNSTVATKNLLQVPTSYWQRSSLSDTTRLCRKCEGSLIS